MTIKASGSLSMSEIVAEYGGPNDLNSHHRGAGYVPSGNTGIPASGAISFSQFYGTSNVIPGANDYSAGTYGFTVPNFHTITFQMWGAGGGAYEQDFVTPYADGGASSVSGIGSAGGGGGPNQTLGGAGGSGNAGTGGTGGNGGQGFSGNGGNGAGPGGGGAAGPGASGNYPGGGAGGVVFPANATGSGAGGGGGYSEYTFSAGQLTPGQALTVIAGAGGVSRSGGPVGASGRVYISWS